MQGGQSKPGRLGISAGGSVGGQQVVAQVPVLSGERARGLAAFSRPFPTLCKRCQLAGLQPHLLPSDDDVASGPIIFEADLRVAVTSGHRCCSSIQSTALGSRAKPRPCLSGVLVGKFSSFSLGSLATFFPIPPAPFKAATTQEIWRPHSGSQTMRSTGCYRKLKPGFLAMAA